MGGYDIGAILAKPVIKYGALALAALALVIGIAWYIRTTYTDGKKAGAAEVTTAVQGEAIKKVEDARKDKAKTDEQIRTAPLDSVIDSLR